MHEALLTQKAISYRAAFRWWMQQICINNLNMSKIYPFRWIANELKWIHPPNLAEQMWAHLVDILWCIKKSLVVKIVFTSWMCVKVKIMEKGNYGYSIWRFQVADILTVYLFSYFFYNKTSYVAWTKVLYNYDRLWFNLQHLLNSAVTINQYITSCEWILWFSKCIVILYGIDFELTF